MNLQSRLIAEYDKLGLILMDALINDRPSLGQPLTDRQQARASLVEARGHLLSAINLLNPED